MRIMAFMLLLCSLLTVACQHAPTVQEKQLADTLAKLSKKAAFVPMDSTSAYKLINEAYLPRLDSLPIKRRIFFRLLKGYDFKAILKRDSAYLARKYQDESFNEPNMSLVPKFGNDIVDTRHSWNYNRLVNTTLIFSRVTNKIRNPNQKDIRRIAGNGYVLLSYPQYNPNTKTALLEEVFEDEFIHTCGTGLDNIVGFKQVGGKWVSMDK